MVEKLFLSVGAMKAGTTWLYDKLKDHPEIHFSYQKEVHYFAHKFGIGEPLSRKKRKERAVSALGSLGNSDLGLVESKRLARWYLDYAGGDVNDEWFEQLMDAEKYKGKYIADFSNLTCHISAEDWATLSNMTSKLKVIYIMRDPIKRLWSHYKFNLQYSGHRLTLDPTKNYKVFERMLSRDRFLRNARYSEVVNTLEASLSAKNVLIGYFEDMIAEPMDFLREVENFLGLSNGDYDEDSLFVKKNTSITVAMPSDWREYAVDVLSEEIDKLKQLDRWSPLWDQY